MIWFEQDSSVELARTYINLLRFYPILEDNSLKTLADFMKNQQFISYPDSSAAGNLFMLGAVIDTRNGSNSFLAALMLSINEVLNLNINLQAIYFEHKFYIYDPAENLICDIAAHWQVRKINFSDYKVFNHAQLLKFMTSLCFCNAVHEDAFRYIQILGELLSPARDTQHLPYPYGGSK